MGADVEVVLRPDRTPPSALFSIDPPWPAGDYVLGARLGMGEKSRPRESEQVSQPLGCSRTGLPGPADLSFTGSPRFATKPFRPSPGPILQGKRHPPERVRIRGG